jgi:hypothetical protein
MANVIGQIAGNDLFRGNLNDRLGKAVETDEYEEQAERITKQIRNKTKTLKKRKALTIDNFDWDVKNADSRYDSLNNDYVKLHNEIQALEESLEEVTAMIDKINNQQITKDGVFKFLMEFGRIYNKLPEINKKELANKFIEKIEIFPEEQEDESVIKSVTFRFPLINNGDRIEMKGGTGLTTLFDGVEELVKDVNCIDRYRWDDLDYLELNVIYKASRNNAKLLSALKKHEKGLMKAAKKHLDSHDESEICKADRTAFEAIVGYYKHSVVASSLQDLIEPAIMYQRMLSRAREIKDNKLVVDSYSLKGGLSADIKSFAVYDYLKAMLGSGSGENGYAMASDVLNAADYGAP